MLVWSAPIHILHLFGHRWSKKKKKEKKPRRTPSNIHTGSRPEIQGNRTDGFDTDSQNVCQAVLPQEKYRQFASRALAATFLKWLDLGWLEFFTQKCQNWKDSLNPAGL